MPITTIFRQKLLTAADASVQHQSDNNLDSSAYGQKVDCGLSTTGSFQVVWASLTGTVDATVQVEVSNDGLHWDAKSGASLTLSGASGHGMISLTETISENYYRVNYQPVDVTGGTVEVFACVK